jgi:ubiquinone/menaquinone biosynthesis C-methylase UbiE
LEDFIQSKRITNEIEHGKFLAAAGAGEIWNWESPAGKVRWKRRVKMLSESITPGMNVLELGCGTGNFTKELCNTKANIRAIDIALDLISIAKENIKNEHVEFLIENAHTMSFPNELFDAVVGSSVLHHLEIDDALKDIFRVLKPGGKILFTEPNMMNPQIALQKNIPFLKRRLGDSPDETAFFRWSLKRKLEKYGFKIVKIIPFDFLHPGTPEILIPAINNFGRFLEKAPMIKEFAGSLYIKALKL